MLSMTSLASADGSAGTRVVLGSSELLGSIPRVPDTYRVLPATTASLNGNCDRAADGSATMKLGVVSAATSASGASMPAATSITLVIIFMLGSTLPVLSWRLLPLGAPDKFRHLRVQLLE